MAGTSVGAGESFLAGVDAWIAGLGQLRDLVRQHVLAGQLALLATSQQASAADGVLDVVDVGCGQGTQAIGLARLGCRVVGVDISTELLARFEVRLGEEPAEVRNRIALLHGSGLDAPGVLMRRFDLVLCHGVLMYLDDLSPMLNALSELAQPTGALSLLVRNGLAPAMRDGLRGRWEDAVKAFDSLRYTNRLGIVARAHTPEQIDSALGRMGWRRSAWYGVRVFTDHLDGAAASSPGGAAKDYAAMLDAESEAARRDPYRQVAALLHLVYRRSGDAHAD